MLFIVIFDVIAALSGSILFPCLYCTQFTILLLPFRIKYTGAYHLILGLNLTTAIKM
jgi:hypothetical protein